MRGVHFRFTVSGETCGRAIASAREEGPPGEREACLAFLPAINDIGRSVLKYRALTLYVGDDQFYLIPGS